MLPDELPANHYVMFSTLFYVKVSCGQRSKAEAREVLRCCQAHSDEPSPAPDNFPQLKFVTILQSLLTQKCDAPFIES